MLRKIISGSILIWIIFLCPYKSTAIDYYWIGGSGSWSDINHWATTSGGTINHLQVPTPLDDVFFDANSFTAANQVVTIDVVNSVCRDINWTGVGFTPTFTGIYDFRIYGSLTIVPNMDWRYYGQIFFESTSLGKTITLAGKFFFSNVYFQGIGGGWLLTDSLTTERCLYLINGSLNTNNQKVNCMLFCSDNINSRTLTLGNSVITCNTSHWFQAENLSLNSDNLTFDAGTSTFKLFGDNTVDHPIILQGSNPLVFHNIETTNDSACVVNVYTCWDIRTKVTIHKFTIWNRQFHLIKNGIFNNVKITIDSLIIMGECEKVFDSIYQLKIQDIVCSQNSSLVLNADQQDTIQNILFSGSLCTINGANAKFHKVILNDDGNINGNNTFDSLSFAQGKLYHLSSGNTQTINSSFTANGNCSGSVIIYSSSNGSQATILKTSGDVITNYIILRDMNATGGANFVANNAVDLGNNTGWIINSSAPLNLYWVGGTGNWNDSNHWSLTNGGPGGACVPSPYDNVFFNANSFSSPGQVVIINAGNAFCNDMDWTGALNSPELSGSTINNLRIYGSLKLIPGMNWSFQGQVMFESTSMGNTITLGGNSLNNSVYFQGVGGGWTLMDAFTSGFLYFITGSLNTNNQSVTCATFNSAISNTRSLTLGSSVVTVNASMNMNGLEINSTNLFFNAGTSVFKVHYTGSSCIISGDLPISFHNIELINYTIYCGSPGACDDNFDIRVKTNIHKLTLSGYYIFLVNNGSGAMVNVKIDSLIVNDGVSIEINNQAHSIIKNSYIIKTVLCNPNSYCELNTDQNDTIQNIFFNGNAGVIYGYNSKFHKVIYTGNGDIQGDNTFDTLSFGAGKRYYLQGNTIINNSFTANGTCSGSIIMYSSYAGIQATIYKNSGDVTVNYVILQDMNATGGASFIANNSVDLGNNTGWIITSASPLNLFWVGGTGNWDDPNHWSLTSGGTGGACIPSPIDNVFFDANSFSAPGQVVTSSLDYVFCNNMDWTGAKDNPTLAGYCYNIRIYGSLKLISEMNMQLGGYINFEATSLGKTITSSGKILNNNNVFFNGNGGSWALTDSFNVGGIYIVNGFLITNNQSITCKAFWSDNPNTRTLVFGSSVVTVNGQSNYPGLTINTTNLSFDAGTSIFQVHYSGADCEISGNQPIFFNNIELTNDSPNCSSIPAMGADNFDIRAITYINKLTLSGQYIHLLNNGLSNAVNVHIDSLIVNDFCPKIIEDKNNYKINTILCNPHTIFSLNTDQNDTVQNILFNGALCTISGENAKFHKVILNGDGNINGNNSFDSLSFAPGRNYHLQSNSTQTINDHLSILGNGCFPITLQSNQSGLQSIISKSSGNVVCGYIEMRDQNATGGATFYAGQYSSNVSNNTGWIFADGPGYIYGLGADTSFCQGDTLLLTTEYFYGGISWLWQDGSTKSYYKVNQPGTYWVKVTYSNDCFYSDTIHVTQKPKPVAVATSNSPVCSGDTIKLYGNGGASYSWTGPFGFSSSLQNPQIINSTPANAGNYILSATQNGCTGSPDTAVVQVAAVFSPSISISASANPVYAGTSVTYTATPTNGGSAPLYQWMVNGINVGTSIPTYTYVPVNGDLVTCVLTSNLTCVTNNPVTSNQITMIVLSGTPCPGIPTVTYEGKTYNTVQIGTQCWFKENLNVGIRENGNQSQTNNGIIEKYCYDDLETNCDIYGGLYLWDEMMQYSTTPGVQGICPTGWHLATDAEWITLTDYLGGENVAGGKMKEAGTAHWLSPNTGATNSSGFTALPGGYRDYGGYFSTLTSQAYFWSSTELSSTTAWGRSLSCNLETVYRFNYYKTYGFSARCLKDSGSSGTASVTTTVVTNITQTTATSGGNVTNDGGSAVTARGVCWNTLLNPTIANSHTTDGTGTGVFVSNLTGLSPNTIYYVRAYATNSVGTAYGNEINFITLNPCLGIPTVDYGGQTYNTVQIGTQCWFRENLNIGTRIDGSQDQLDNGIKEKYCYNDLESNCDVYGGLYQWREMMQYSTTPGVQGICPTGWHLATDEEWTTLTDYLGGENVAGGPMKEAGTAHWLSPNTGATNSSGFTALPGGYRDGNGSFGNLTNVAYFWSSTEYSSTYAWYGYLYFGGEFVNRGSNYKTDGFSARCLKDGCTSYYEVSVSINPSANPICNGNVVTFTAIPTNGGTAPFYQWKVNGNSVGTNSATYSYTPVNNDIVTCVLTSNATCATGSPATSNTITMAVNSNLPVSVSITATENPVCAGTSVIYTATPTNGGSSPSFQWKVNGLNVGTDSPNYSYIPADNDVITCVLTSNANCATGSPAISNLITMAVNSNLPVSVLITTTENPVCAGTSVTYTATPTNGGSSPSYQWKINGLNVGTDSPIYSYIPANNDVITCVLTSNASCATGSPAISDPITMSVNATLPVSVSITPSGNPVCAGTSVTFTATPTNGGTLPAYQWKVNGSNVGTNSSTYSYTPVNGDIVTCILISNAICATENPATSDAITMTVNSTMPVSVSIAATENPVCAGTSVTYTASPTNGGTLPSYQWKVNGLNVGINNLTYSYTPANGDIVTCILTSNATCATGNPATSNSITMTVNSNLSVSVSIAPSGNPVCTGTLVTYMATPINGGSSPSYQWTVNGLNVGNNNPIYSYTPANNDIITCMLTSNASCATGNPATSDAITMAVNSTLPVSVSITATQNPICAGTSVTYTAIPINGGTLPAYQWKVNGSNVGTNSATYSYTPANNDIITCILTSNASCVTGNPATSDAITMTVNSTLPVSVSIAPSGNPVCTGTLVTYTATPTNGGTLPAYQWKVNGNSVGTNSATYSNTPVNGDLVICIFTSSEQCTSNNPTSSNQILMVVNTGLPAGVSITASSNPFCPGLSVTFTATPINGGVGPEYQWKVNGINTGTNSSIFTYNPTDGDSVRCVMTSNLGCATGNPTTSAKIIMNGTLAPIVTFTTCFDTITTVNAKPIKLKGGIPLGGTYSGSGVSNGYFNPNLAGIGTKIITYSYTNVSLCSASKTKTINVQSAPTFTCGNNLIDIRDNKEYSTVQIGSQCWMAANLNYGTMLISSLHQSDNCIPEKYCYNDLATNCQLGSIYYQWDEIMQYDETPGLKGLCPPGWHIPTEPEWDTLFTNWTNNGYAGSHLKYSGSSGFNALLSGVNHFNKQWDFHDFATFFWSSTANGPFTAWAHGMNDYNPGVSLYPSSRVNAFSVRCLHDN